MIPRNTAPVTVQVPEVGCLTYTAWTLWALGYPEQALERSHEAFTLAQELSHPFSLAFALNWAAFLHQLRREGQATQKRAEAAMALSAEQGFPVWLGFGTVFKGWALVEQGQREEGIAQLRQGMAAMRATGAELYQPYCLALLAEAYEKVGQAEEGVSVLTEALDLIDKTEERWYEAELYRLKGTLTLQSKVSKSRAGPKGQQKTVFRKRLRSLTDSRRNR